MKKILVLLCLSIYVPYTFASANVPSTESAIKTIIVDNKANAYQVNVQLQKNGKNYSDEILIQPQSTTTIKVTTATQPGSYTLHFALPYHQTLSWIPATNNSIPVTLQKDGQTISMLDFNSLKSSAKNGTIIINNSQGSYRVNVQLTQGSTNFSDETTVPAGGSKVVETYNVKVPDTYSLYTHAPDVSSAPYDEQKVQLTKDGQTITLPYVDYSYYLPGGY